MIDKKIERYDEKFNYFTLKLNVISIFLRLIGKLQCLKKNCNVLRDL